MDNKNQNINSDPRAQCDYEKNQLEHEIVKRRQAEERAEALTKQLNAVNAQMASFEKNMEERIRFDVLLSEISANFINLPSNRIDREIGDAQRRICECLGLSMSLLWQWEPENPGEFVLTSLYRPMGGPADRIAIDRFAERICSGRDRLDQYYRQIFACRKAQMEHGKNEH